MKPISLIYYLLSLIFLFSSCSTTKKSPVASSPVAVAFSADSAYAYCAAQCSFGPRTMNSEAHERCGQWIADKFRTFGCAVTLQSAMLRGWDGADLRATNIIATTPRDTTAREPLPRILLCAHWDSRPWADNDADSANWHKPVLAANDGASGVAVMLEVARQLQLNDSARHAVDFICFDAEDRGVPQWSDAVDGDSWCLGSRYWASHPQPLNPRDYAFAIVLDMVGGQGGRFYHEGYSLQHASSVVSRVWSAAAAAGYGSVFISSGGGYITDDHVPVNETAGIPCIDIVNHNPDCPQSSFGPTWHTVHDDLQHLDPATLKAVGQTLLQILYTAP